MLKFIGYTDDDRAEYAGRVITSSGRAWEFNQLCSAVGASNNPQTVDLIAASVVSFGSYFSTYNRGDDVPDWAPPGDLADEIRNDADTGDKGYFIRRKKHGRVVCEY